MVIPAICRYFVPKLESMKQHFCLISIGTNTNRAKNIKLAQELLLLNFPQIHLGKEMDTEPIGIQNSALFTNQLAMMQTKLSIEEIRQILKNIEIQIGRIPEDKEKGIIKMDIDLLMYDSTVLKVSDLKKEFIIAGLKEFGL